jgi:site-specific recombinase XerC
MWKLTVTIPGGGRVNRTVEGDTDDARRQLAVLAVQRRGGARTLDRLVAAHLAQLHDVGRSPETLRRYHQLWRDWLSPTLGHIPPDRVGRTDIEDTLKDMAGAGMSTRSIHQATGVLSSALAWACERGDLNHNPAIGAQLPDGTQRGRRRT